jgi:hypothetical protein
MSWVKIKKLRDIFLNVKKFSHFTKLSTMSIFPGNAKITFSSHFPINYETYIVGAVIL